MALSQYQRLLFDLAEAVRQNATSERDGWVYDVQKDKVRVAIGVRNDGTPWLTPWLHTNNHRGGSRERVSYVKGQNVRLSVSGGDFRQAVVRPGGESKSFPPPAHADSVDGESWQLGKMRISRHKNSDGGVAYDMWVADQDDNPPPHQDQPSGPTTQTSQSQQQQSNPGTPTMKVRISEKGFITGRVGKNVRFAAHEKGAKLWAQKDGGNKHYIVATPDGLVWSETPSVGDDPVPNDDN